MYQMIIRVAKSCNGMCFFMMSCTHSVIQVCRNEKPCAHPGTDRIENDAEMNEICTISLRRLKKQEYFVADQSKWSGTTKKNFSCKDDKGENAI